MEAQQQRIKELETQVAEWEKRAKSFEQDWSKLFDQNKALREKNLHLQQDYEALRIQKGGFGFKSMLFSGMGGFLTALMLCFVYLKLKPKPQYARVFDRFQKEHLFNYELKLSNGDFNAVELSLQECKKRAEYQIIQPEIYFAEKLVGAAKRNCENK
jgi:septal ring factor EnvC (AmiA/AmiB activator)